MIRIFSKYIVTEIKRHLDCLVLKGMNFYNVQTYKFWAIFLLMMSNITSFQGHSSESFITLSYKIHYYLRV